MIAPSQIQTLATLTEADWRELFSHRPDMAGRLRSIFASPHIAGAPAQKQATPAAPQWSGQGPAIIPDSTPGHALVERAITYWLYHEHTIVGTICLPDNTGAGRVRLEAADRDTKNPITGPNGGRRLLRNHIAASQVRVYNEGLDQHSVFFKPQAQYLAEVNREPTPRILATVVSFSGPRGESHSVEFDATDLAMQAFDDGLPVRDESVLSGKQAANPGTVLVLRALPRYWKHDDPESSGFRLTIEASMQNYLKDTGREELLAIAESAHARNDARLR